MAGRPRCEGPRGPRLTRIVAVRLTREEAAIARVAARRAGMTLAQFGRRALVRAARRRA